MEATDWRIRKYVGWISGCIGAVLAYLGGFDLLEHYVHGQDNLHLAANIYIVILSVIILIFAAFRQWSSIRKERYANVTPIYHQIMHQIRDLHTFICLTEPKNGNQKEYEDFFRDCKMVFGRIMDQLTNVFVSITSTHCRTSIKLMYKKNDKLYVYTLTRDQGSRQTWLTLDNERVSDDHDPLEANLQFARMFSDNEQVWHYISNDLTRDEKFRSTSITAYNPDFGLTAPVPDWAFWRKRWPLPYKSTVACVIRQGPIDVNQGLRSEVLGFLTLDSESRGVFEERWDVQIMFAVADALYAPIRAFLDAQNRAQNGHNNIGNAP